MERIAEILRRHWGYSDLRPLQREAMASVLRGRDSLVVLPTGGGKSLCFQAPALALPGLAVVVSPLISLMKDQVDALTDSGVAAARLDSSQTADEQSEVVAAIRRGELKILYVSPERLLMNGFARFLGAQKLSLIAVDEAHCVSMWGHDFRPEYRQLGELRQAFPRVAIHAYTATATRQVRDDIVEQLRLRAPEVLVGSFDRPNLLYSVESRADDGLRQIRAVLDRHAGESSIVYCIRRADVDAVAEKLTGAGYRAAAYHAGLSDEARRNAQDAFISEEADVIVATVAFGMGIDKSNVRAVIHAGMPKSLEHYQQESGRAGRDGLDAECVLLYGPGDYGVWKYIIEQSESEEAKRIAMAKLGDIVAYATGAVCRHRALLHYFGQELEGGNCNACDVCFGDLELVDDALVLAQKILSCVHRLEERYGGDYTAAVLTGSREERILTSGHDALSTYGLLADEPKKRVRDWIEQLAGQGYLSKEGEYNLLTITPSGRRVLRGEETPRLLKPAAGAVRAATAGADSWEGVDRGLFDTLRVLRRGIAEEKKVPAYIVFGDAALRDMARRRPTTVEGFLQVSGVGEAKARQYGEAFVAAIREFCRNRELETDVDPDIKAVPKPTRKGSKARATVDLARPMVYERFDRGQSLDAVVDGIGKSPDAVLEYLLGYLREKKLASPEPWVDAATFDRISEVARVTGTARPINILRQLNGLVTYDQVKIAIVCIENGE
ncbi:MAG: DNA helicase RecQ [Candidatus Bipolaricaulis sp.]|nr:DNA helicase RecQ [Candidatus Bipolaricaulis sp.]